MTKALTDGWGNPSHSTFKKRLIRQVVVDDHRLLVHTDLVPIVEHLVLNLVQTDLVIATLEGYPAEPRGLGVRIVLDPPNPRLVTDAMGKFGFTPEGEDDLYVWSLTREQALEAALAIDAEPSEDGEDGGEGDDGPSSDIPAGGDAPEHVNGDPTCEVSANTDPATGWEAVAAEDGWFDGLPATRDLIPGRGMKGRDVVFLQAYLDVPRTGRYDSATVNAVGYFLGRRGLPADGAMYDEAWRQLIPRVRRPIFSGENGRYIRVISAAMIAAGHLPADFPVSPRYDRRLQGVIRDMQEARGGVRTGRITSVEWSYLLGHPWVG